VLTGKMQRVCRASGAGVSRTGNASDLGAVLRRRQAAALQGRATKTRLADLKIGHYTGAGGRYMGKCYSWGGWVAEEVLGLEDCSQKRQMEMSPRLRAFQ